MQLQKEMFFDILKFDERYNVVSENHGKKLLVKTGGQDSRLRFKQPNLMSPFISQWNGFKKSTNADRDDAACPHLHRAV